MIRQVDWGEVSREIPRPRLPGGGQPEPHVARPIAAEPVTNPRAARATLQPPAILLARQAASA